jgi:hypothetical protein
VILEVVSRQAGDLARVGKDADGTFANRYGFPFAVTFAGRL